jgi:GMP synthase (glutamine-hydrolysing)
MLKRVCVYRVGQATAEVAAEHGTYEDWFGRLLAEHDQLEVTWFDGTSGRVPGDIDEYAAVVITGSASSLTVPEPWMEAGIELVRHSYQHRQPLLGVCFGHQMIGAAFGGSVVPNPRGWTMGTREVEVRVADDPLFAGLPERFEVNLSHRDIVDAGTLSERNGIRVLAGNPKAAVQALAAGPHVRGIQFHPEFTGAVTRTYLRRRRQILSDDATARNAPEDHPDRLTETTRDTPVAEELFHNFFRNFVLGR